MVMLSAIAALLVGASGSPVTVEIVTSGHIESPADRYRVTGSLLACAATQAEADAQLAQKSAAIERSMIALGAARANAAATFSLAGMMGSMMATRTASECNKSGLDDLAALADDNKPAEEKKPLVGASAALTYDAPDSASAARVIAALKAADAKPSDKAVPVLIDDIAARRAAKQQALAKARAEADAYGGPLGLGKATMTKISERQDLGSMDFIGQMFRTIGLPGTIPPDKVVTDVTLTVEFQLDGR